MILNCLLPAAAASAIGIRNDEIKMEILRASSASEFSHSLDPYRKLTPSPLADPYALITGAQYTDFRCIP
jgi:hypothetical protein